MTGYCRFESEPKLACPRGDASVPDPTIDARLADGPEPLADASELADARGPDARFDAAAPVPDARPVDAALPPDAACLCDPLEGQSCCSSGDACDIQANVARCRDVTSADQQAAACQTATGCAAGYSCVAGTCHEFCDDDGDCVGGGALCDLRVGTTAFRVCTSFCDPLSGSGCESGWACELGENPADDRWHTDCRAAGSVAPGGACSGNDDCGRGFACAGSPTRCVSYCNSQQQDDAGCPGTPSCQLGPASPVIDGVTWGVCL